MTENLISNNTENDQFNLNKEESDYKSLSKLSNPPLCLLLVAE